MASRQTIANYSMITKDAWEVDALYREPYILKGYRKPCCSLKESACGTCPLSALSVNRMVLTPLCSPRSLCHMTRL